MNRADDASIRRLIEDATETLGSDSGRLDAEVLLTSILKKNRSHLHAWPGKVLSRETCRRFFELVNKRAAGEPVAYLTGMREFWSLPLAVSPDTLIPRPETETLVTLALEKIPPGSCLQIADLGTGSGAIALAIASERPGCRIIATELSEKALAVAAANAGNLGIENVTFIHGSWFDPLPHEAFDLILSNPPYVEEQDNHLEHGDIRFEPRAALVAGPDGMDDLRQIVKCARFYLRSQGWLLVEHGYNQADRVNQLFNKYDYHEISSHSDEARLDRVCMGRILAPQR